MLTPVTGVDRLPLGRPALASRPDSTFIERARARAEQKRIWADIERASADWKLTIVKLVTVFTGVTALMCGLLWPAIGGHLAAALVLLCVVCMSYYGICWIMLARGVSLVPLTWFNVTFEAMLGTLVLGVITSVKGPEWAASSPAIGLYHLVIVLAATRMRPLLCVYSTGLVLLQYLFAYHLLLLPKMAPELVASLPTLAGWAAWERAFWLVLTGVAATILTFKLRSLAYVWGAQIWQRRRLERELGRYVSRDVAQAILRGEATLGLAERREVTVLFCDLRDFTSMCEKEQPEHVVHLLNEFYERACRVIESHGGTVNKFLGDGLLALFGAPDEHPNHAHAAAEAAHEILGVVRELRQRPGIWTRLDVGIGLDTGDVVVGPVGSPNRLEYTAIGPTVNRAARLQGLSQKGRHRIVLSQTCLRALGPRANVIGLGKIYLKGFSTPEPVYAFRHS